MPTKPTTLEPGTQEFGGKAENKTFIDSWSNAMYIWQPNKPLTYGKVVSFKIYARRTGDIYMQVSI